MRDVVVGFFLYALAALRVVICLRPRVLHDWGVSARGLDLLLRVLVAMILLTRFVVFLNYIPSASMEPTLEIHDVFLDNRLAYCCSRPRRGDLVTFKHRGDLVVKRIAGIEGDEVALVGGQLIVNGESVEEPYVRTDGRDYPPHRVALHCVFLLGDNRARSDDSRDFRDVSESALVGRVSWRIWPFSRWGLPR
jgi:signal peptidase I